MALSEARHWLWNKTAVYNAVAAADLPSFDAGSSFNIGDIVVNLSPVVGGPAMWMCLTGGTSPTWAQIATVGGNIVRSSASPVAITTADKTVVFTGVGAVAVSIPVATAFPTGSDVMVINNATGSATITPASGTIAGAATLVLTTNTATILRAIGTNNWANLG